MLIVVSHRLCTPGYFLLCCFRELQKGSLRKNHSKHNYPEEAGRADEEAADDDEDAADDEEGAKVVFFSFFLSFIFLGESPQVALAISIYKRSSNGFRTHCHKHISGETRSKMHLKRAFEVARLAVLMCCPKKKKSIKKSPRTLHITLVVVETTTDRIETLDCARGHRRIRLVAAALCPASCR